MDTQYASPISDKSSFESSLDQSPLSASGFGPSSAGVTLPAPAFQLKASSGSLHSPNATRNTNQLPAQLKSGIESMSGIDMSDVTVNYNSDQPAQLNAHAFAQGSEIHLGPGQEKHLPHEAWHVVQQKQGRVQPTTEVNGKSINDNPQLEREADSMGDKATQLRSITEKSPAKRVSHEIQLKQLKAKGKTLQAKKIDTNGGTWDTAKYKVKDQRGINGSGKAVHAVGAEIKLQFEPNELVEADNIGITQTVKTMKSSAGDPKKLSTPSYVSKRNQKLSLTSKEGDEGRAIDQGDNSVVPNTNPMYAVENTATQVSKTPTDVKPVAANGFGEHGYRKKVGNAFKTKKAWIYDGPTRLIEFPKQQYEHTFEATALVLDGPMKDTYLGSVEWGWSSDTKEKPSLKNLKMVRSGTPTGDFMKAAKKWNDATFKQGGKEYDTVDLPLATSESGTQTANSMKTNAIWKRLQTLKTQAKGLNPKQATDKTNQGFEIKALEAELAKRKVKVFVKINSDEDWFGDEVKVTLTNPKTGKSVSLPYKTLDDGESGSFYFDLQKLLPLGGPLTIEVVDVDGPFDSNDHIGKFNWQAPYTPKKKNLKKGAADYDVSVKFQN
ncbi:MAG: DUF4157 domain-containing protein [Bacteroidota bacterium]